MRIGIDCRTILNPDSGERAGVGHYTYHLVRALLDHDRDNDYVLFFDYRMPREATQEFIQANTKIAFFPFSSYGRFLPFAYSHMLVSAALLKHKLDLFHGPANTVPLTYPRKTMITIHDLAIYKHPEWFPTQMFSTRLLVPQSIKHAKHIVAVSEATKKDVQDLFNVPDKKISVIPEAADTDVLDLQDQHHDVHTIYQLPKRYVLFVGTIEPRKNLQVLFEAWKRLVLHSPETVNDMQLILAGGIGYGGEPIIAMIKKMNMAKHIRHIGYVSHNHKILLMQQASSFVFPTLYEGFGLPVLEAMQLGIPVVATNTSSIPEVTGSAAALVEPTDVEGLAQALKKVLDDRAWAKQLGEHGQEQAKKFSWKKTALDTAAVYRQTASQ